MTSFFPPASSCLRQRRPDGTGGITTPQRSNHNNNSSSRPQLPGRNASNSNPGNRSGGTNVDEEAGLPVISLFLFNTFIYLIDPLSNC